MIQMYLQNEHYALWEVIEFGDSYKDPLEESRKGPASESSAKKKGMTVVITTKDIQVNTARPKAVINVVRTNRVNDVKASVCWVWKPIKPNNASITLKRYDYADLRGRSRFVMAWVPKKAIVSHLEFMDVEIEQDDLNHKFLTSLAPEWLMYTIVWRNRDDLDTMSLDDVYNHLKVYEPEVQNKSESNSQNMAFTFSSNTSSGKGKVHTTSVPTTSTQVSTASIDVAAASLSHDTVCAYIASQSNGSQIKYEDITQIDEDDIEEIDIKWNMAFLSMRADRFWKKTGKKITIQGSDVAGFDKSKVECFNYQKMSHFARECRAPRSQDRGKRESYKQGHKEEEPAPNALMAIDGIGWDWSYMANEEENHALVADDEAPTEFAFMAKSSSSSENEVYDDSYGSKSCRKNTENLNTKISKLNEERSDCETDLYHYKRGLSQVKKEKEGLDNKLTGFESASKDLDNLLGSQRLDKNKEGLRYNVVPPPPPAQVYLPPKRDLSWTGLPEFVDDTVIDYSKPTPSIDTSKCNTSDLQSSNFFVSEHGESSGSILSKPMIKFVKATDCPRVIKTNNTKNARKSTVKYVEMYRNTSKSPKVRVRTQPRVPRVFNVTKKFPTVDSKFPTVKSTFTADLGNKGKAVKASACWIWRPKQNTIEQGLNCNGVSVTFKKYQYIDTQGRLKSDSGCSRHMTGNISYLSEYGPYDYWFTWTFFLRTKDETTIILRSFITDIENLKDLKAEAVNTSCYVQNRVLVNKSQNKTPYELFNSRTPTIGFLRPFGCHVMILNTLDHLGKFDAKGDEGYFVGYSLSSKASMVFNKRTKKLEENLHVDFLENKLIEKGAGPNWLFDIDTLTNSMNYVPVVVAGTSSTNISGTKDVASQAVKKYVSSLKYIALPNWFHEAHMETRNSDGCNADDPESRVRPIGTKWVLKNKKDERGIVIRNKAKLVAQGYTQEEGIDYEEVFAPVARIDAIRLFLAYASFMGFIVYQMDVKSAFLYSTIDEGVYVMQPLGFQDPEFPDRVYKVEKAIHQVTPKECYLHAVKRIFRHLKGHPKLRLWYPKESPFDLVAYLDSDYGSATQDRKSTTGGCQFLGRRLISWQCKKQTIVATSTTEAGYVAAASGCGQVLWIQNQMLDYGNFIMAKLAFCDYHNMIAILEKTEHNTDFQEIVDFLEASHIRYALTISPTIYVSHIRQFWSTARIETTNQETKILTTVDDEPASLSRDNRQREAFPTVSSLDAGQDMENIAKTSALPHESSPRVTSFDADEGSMQQRLHELIELYTSLQRRQSYMAAKIKDQDLEISRLKARVQSLEDKERRRPNQEDAPITGGIMKKGEELGTEKSTELGSNNTEEMVNVLSLMDAANILTSGVTAASVSPAAGVLATGVHTVSGSFPTVSAIFTTASVVTPYTRRPRGIAIGAKEMEEEFARENQRVSEQLTKDSEIARLHAEEELKMMIEGLDRSNEVIVKHLQEYEQATVDLSVGEKIELISELVKYQDHRTKILKYQAQQSKPLSKKEQREFYMSVLRIHAGWQGLKIDQVSSKRMKTSKSVSEEELKGMMQLVPLEEVYVEALQRRSTLAMDFSQGNLQYMTGYKRQGEGVIDWKLYDTCGVHHVSTKDQEIFMLVEKDYPLRRGLATVMICNKLQERIVRNKMLQGIPTASDGIPPASAFCDCHILYRTPWPIKGVLRVTITLLSKVVDPTLGNNNFDPLGDMQEFIKMLIGIITRQTMKLGIDMIKKGQNPSKTGQKQAQSRKRGKVNSQKISRKYDGRSTYYGGIATCTTEGYAEAIVVPPILAEQFELKHSLINMMTMDQFFGLEKDNPRDHIRWFNKITSTITYKDVPNSEDFVSKFINEFFPSSRTTNLRNEISNFQQRFEESFHEAWDRYKDLLRACPHHGFTELHQLDTFYNALNPADQDSLNAGAGGNLLEIRTQDTLTIIENKSKVRNSLNKSVVSQVKSCDANSNYSSEIAKLTHDVNQQTSAVTTAMTAILKQFQATPPPASVKAVEEIYVTCGGAHPGLVIDGPTVPTPPPFINPKEDERVEETLTDPYLSEYTIKVQPPPVQKYKPPSQRDFIVHPRDPFHPNIPYPSWMLKQKQQEKDEVQIHKFWQMFKQLHINITLDNALILMPKYQKMLKALLSNKEKLQELENTPLNENCSAVILKKLLEKLGDPGKFLIPCGFSELK
nr:hypothetical protein [Tanacetum cinerariifolium]